MPSATDYIDALVHYRTMFPDESSLGTEAETWKAELDRVTATAFDPLVATSASLEGGNVSGMLNFTQKLLARALHARRAELDEDYVNPYTVAFEEPMPPRRSGFIVTLGDLR